MSCFFFFNRQNQLLLFIQVFFVCAGGAQVTLVMTISVCTYCINDLSLYIYLYIFELFNILLCVMYSSSISALLDTCPEYKCKYLLFKYKGGGHHILYQYTLSNYIVALLLQ